MVLFGNDLREGVKVTGGRLVGRDPNTAPMLSLSFIGGTKYFEPYWGNNSRNIKITPRSEYATEMTWFRCALLVLGAPDFFGGGCIVVSCTSQQWCGVM